jgi:hypothetical protein
MLAHRRRTAVLVVGTVIVTALAWLAYSTFGPPRQSRDVSMPSADATPEEVVGVYLDALDAHDCDTAADVVVADRAEGMVSCDSVEALSEISVRERFDHYTRPSSPGTEVTYVSVRFDLDWRRFHGDGSMPEGTTVWGYVLERSSSANPWRLIRGGVG